MHPELRQPENRILATIDMCRRGLIDKNPLPFPGHVNVGELLKRVYLADYKACNDLYQRTFGANQSRVPHGPLTDNSTAIYIPPHVQGGPYLLLTDQLTAPRIHDLTILVALTEELAHALPGETDFYPLSSVPNGSARLSVFDNAGALITRLEGNTPSSAKMRKYQARTTGFLTTYYREKSDEIQEYIGSFPIQIGMEETRAKLLLTILFAKIYATNKNPDADLDAQLRSGLDFLNQDYARYNQSKNMAALIALPIINELFQSGFDNLKEVLGLLCTPDPDLLINYFINHGLRNPHNMFVNLANQYAQIQGLDQ